MNLKNKILITFFILLAFVLFFNINIYAYTFEDYPDIPTVSSVGNNDSSLYIKDIIIQTNNTGESIFTIVLYHSIENSLKITKISNSDEYVINVNSDDTCYYYIYQLDNNNSKWDLVWQTTINSGNFYKRIMGDTLVSTLNIYNEDDSVFFQVPPQIVEGITIPALETAEQIPQAIVTTLKILIPVGLIVLSIGLVVYLIKRVRYSIM